MKFNIIYTKQVVLATFLIISFQQVAFSQDSRKGKQYGFFISPGVSFSPSQPQFVNEGSISGSELKSANLKSFVPSLEVGYFLQKFVGLSIGVGYTSYKSNVTLDAFQNKFDTKDSENEAYEMQVSGEDIREIQEVSFINIPVCLNFRIPFTYNKKIGLMLQGGVKLAIPAKKSYTSTGTFTYKGNYPAYNVLLENLPEYGFPSNLISTSNGALVLQVSSLSSIFSAGLYFVDQNNIQLSVDGFFSNSLSNISAYTSTNTFQLTPEVGKINSLMGGSSNVSAKSIGIKVSFRFFL